MNHTRGTKEMPRLMPNVLPDIGTEMVWVQFRLAVIHISDEKIDQIELECLDPVLSGFVVGVEENRFRIGFCEHHRPKETAFDPGEYINLRLPLTQRVGVA